MVARQFPLTIQREIAIRADVHQTRVAPFAAAGAADRPLVFLAHGDSWFDYPLSGNDISFGDTDVIAQLRTMGQPNPLILNVAHHGDSTIDELSLPKQQRLIDVLKDGDNWLNAGKPDAILFSGDGNDIAGEQFCMYVDPAAGGGGLSVSRFEGALAGIEASYLELFAFRDRYAKEVPIFAHCYDFGIPNGSAPLCAGPWLKPSLDFLGYGDDLARTRAIVRTALQAFRTRLVGLAGDPANNFHLVDTQGTLIDDRRWANELHPDSDGFKAIADKFLGSLQAFPRFAGRI
jgi:hypothetical protein